MLQQLVGELGKGHTLRVLAVEAFLDGIFRHHIVDGNKFAHIARKVKERIVFHPVVVVDQFGCVGCVRIEVKEMFQLLAYGGNVMAQSLFGKQVTFGGLAGRVTNHTCGTSDKGNRFMAAALQVTQHHNAAQVPYMETICRRIYAYVCRGGLFHQLLFRAGHNVLQHPAPTKFFYKILSHCFMCIVIVRLFQMYCTISSKTPSKVRHFS